MRALMDKALNRGYVLLPLAAPHRPPGRAGLHQALDRASSLGPLPAAVEATPRMTHEQSSHHTPVGDQAGVSSANEGAVVAFRSISVPDDAPHSRVLAREEQSRQPDDGAGRRPQRTTRRPEPRRRLTAGPGSRERPAAPPRKAPEAARA